MMLRVNDTFVSADERIRALLAQHKDEPQGYVPQHHLAHVRWPQRQWRHGYPIHESDT